MRIDTWEDFYFLYNDIYNYEYGNDTNVQTECCLNRMMAIKYWLSIYTKSTNTEEYELIDFVDEWRSYVSNKSEWFRFEFLGLNQ